MQLKIMSASLAATLGLAIAEISCLTQEDCEIKSQEMKMESFNPGIFPTKGCYSKNNNAFFSLGTEEEMSSPDLPGVQERIWCHIACLTEEDCAKKSQEMVGMIPGMVSFNPGDYPTKGCFFKNNNAFFSPGTEEEMSTPDLPGVQERIWCDVSTMASTSAPTSSLTKSPTVETVLTSAMPTNDSTNNPTGQSETVCLTPEDCEQKSQEMGMESFTPGNFPTKGCYSKTNKAYFSPGTEEEMSEPDVSGIQERIWCDIVTSSNGTENTTAFTSAPTSSLTNSPTAETVLPSAMPTKIEESSGLAVNGTENTTASTSAPTSSLTKSPTAETVLTSAMPTESSGLAVNGTENTTASTSAPTLSLTKSPTLETVLTSAMPTIESTNNPTGQSKTACLTQEDCEQKSQEMGMESFTPGNFPTKGCYSKTNKAYFSPGTEEEMSEPDVSGIQERIWCDIVTSSNGTENTTAFTSAPTSSPTKSLSPSVETTLTPAPINATAPSLSPEKKPNDEPTKGPTINPTGDALSPSPTSNPTDDALSSSPTSNPTDDALSPSPTRSPSGNLVLRPAPLPSTQPTKEPTTNQADPVSGIVTGIEKPVESSSPSTGATILNHGITGVVVMIGTHFMF
eukprot:CAMPEP_0201903060 /NCGR_PEP_ID=MMETSP0902-20130614/55281_1 /ASSEMBLY_ACC=CAM_ASM_000551 /TAXON_ID=420261 /ORGANISM="Thalassiosira antarctica, Strain CCMP982" /LENGTH=623 /DNA_ID=CAMNT_0048437093 /DNA_START=68 /DNA_END=1939 /DNA_ORIENTATION=+